METCFDPQIIARNVWRGTLQDGLFELSTGLGMLLIAGILSSSSSFSIVFVAILGPIIVKRLKERYTYPRLGFVDLPEKSKNPGPLMLLALGMAIAAIALLIFLAGGINDSWGWNKWLPLLPAILFQAGLIPLGTKSGLNRYYLMAGIALVLGIACTLPTLPGRVDNLSLYLWGIGTILAAWGALLLIVFLHRYPVLAVDARDDK